MKSIKFLLVACLLSAAVLSTANANPQNRVAPPSIDKIMRSFLKDNRIYPSRIWILPDEVRSIFGFEITRSQALYPKVRFQIGQDLIQCTYTAGELSPHMSRPNEYILMGFRVYDCRNQTQRKDINYGFNDTFNDGARFFNSNRSFVGLTWEEKYELLGGGNYGAEAQDNVSQLAAGLSSDNVPEEAFVEIDPQADTSERYTP